MNETDGQPNPVKKKYFTVEQANQALPLVKAVVADIVRQYLDIQERKERLARIRPASSSKKADADSMYAEEMQHVEEELEREVGKLQEYVLELHSLGVEIKDFQTGLVDFPALFDGREVYLCWKLGEPEVAFWHEIDAGFSGRQSLLAGSLGNSKDTGNSN